MVHVGDILYALYGATSGEVDISKINGAINQAILCIRSEKIENVFLKNLLLKLKFHITSTYLQGGQGNLSAEIIKNLHSHIPSKTEQQKIADFLSLVDERIEKQRQLVEVLKRYKRGVINGTFDNKIQGQNWKTYRLSEILTERCTYCEKDGTYEHVTLSREGIFPKTERYDRDYLVSSDDKRYKITKCGDICYNPANMKFGVICLNTYGDAIFSPIYVTFEITSNIDKNMLAFCITRQNFINKSLKYQQGTVYERMAVSPEDLLSMTIHLPDEKSQKEISQLFVLIDESIKREIDKLTTLQRLKSGLLQQMFI